MKSSKLQSKTKNWEMKKLGEVAEYINGRAFKPSEWETKGLPIVRIQNLTETSDVFNCFSGDLEERYRIENGDVLLSWSASLGVYIWNKGSAALNQHIFKVVPKETVVAKKYLFFVLQSMVSHIHGKVHGSTMKHITKPVFERIKIPVPPFEIQHQIVERLDAIRKAQELNDKQIALADELFQSLLQKELYPQKNWERKKLGQISEFLDNQRIPLNEIERSKRKGSFPYYGATGLLDWVDDFIFDGEFVLLAEDGGPFLEKDKPIAYRVSGKCWVNNHAHVLKARDKVNIDFLGYSLMFYDLKPYLTGSTRLKLNKSRAEKIIISLPPLKTQHQIVAKLQAVQNIKKSLIIQKTKLKELFDSVLDKSMKGALDSKGES